MLIDNTDKIIQQFNNAMRDAFNEIGITGTAQIQALAPVDTGNLRRSYAYKVSIGSKDFVVVFGTNITYAVYVEMKPEARGGRPHLRKVIESEIEEFNKILRKHLQRVGK